MPAWAKAGLQPSKAITANQNRLVLFPDQLRRETIGRRHEFRADGITDRLLENPVDLVHRRLVDVPTHDVGDWRELTGAARAPQGDIGFAAVEHPARRQVNHPPAEAV